MNVFYFCSEAYASIAAVSMLSLLRNNQTLEKINFFIADDGITAESKSSLLSMAAGFSSTISFISLPGPSELLDFPFSERYQIGHSYPRMCIPSLLPIDVDRVLCLDSDTLILGDLGDLWNMDLGEDILAGVPDCINVHSFQKQFELDESAIYCNAGVFLIDIGKWREQDVDSRIKEYIRRKHGNVFFFEQTTMNYCFRGKIRKLPLRYNVYSILYSLPYKSILDWRRPLNFYSEREVKDAVSNPTIVHFTRIFYMKSHPWKRGSEHPLTAQYREYMESTPWAELWDDRDSLSRTVGRLLARSVPQRIACKAIGFIYNVVRPKLWWRNE